MALRHEYLSGRELLRDRIPTSQLIEALVGHALGSAEIDQTRIKAIEILLKKTLPDLKAHEHTGEVELTWNLKVARGA
jgi:hypothetical protein